MGLDMYLHAKRYLWKSGDHPDTKIADAVTAIFSDEIPEGSTDNFGKAPVSYITTNVGYWRKANAIHAWFISQCADGVDNCEPVYISRDDLKTLDSICRQVLKDHSAAETLLPTSSGFFFGSTEYDEWYFKSLSGTVHAIATALKYPDTWDLYYKASW